MKGIVFNLLEEVVSQAYGEAAWDGLLERAELDGVYTSLGSYPDQEIEALLVAAAEVLDSTPGDCLQWFGREAMPLLAGRFPAFFVPHRTTLPFILSLNTIIHPEVRKLHPGAMCPTFDFEQRKDGTLLMGYTSERNLCRLAEGFIEGAAAHFGERAEIEHLHCMAKGDPECLLGIRLHAGNMSDGFRAA